MKLLIHSQASTIAPLEWISYFIPHFIGHVITSLLELNLLHFSKKGPFHVEYGLEDMCNMFIMLVWLRQQQKTNKQNN